MGYPNFGKVKTIVLPIHQSDQDLTIDEYKEKYGIDLRDIVVLSDGHIYLKNDNLYLLHYVNQEPWNILFNTICDVNQTQWVSASNTGILALFPLGTNSEWYIRLIIDKDDDFSIDNLKIDFEEV